MPTTPLALSGARAGRGPAHSARRARLAALAVLALAAAAGCDDDPLSPDGREVRLAVTDLTAPAAFTGTTPIPVALTVNVGGCLSFRRIEQARSGDQVTLRAVGRDVSGPGVACSTELRQERHETAVSPPAGDVLTLAVEGAERGPLTATLRRQ